MSEISLFAQKPLVLLLKIKKFQNNTKRDNVNGVLFDGLDDCAAQLELFSAQALSAQNEREGIEALHNAYMKVASTRYYLEVLYQTGYIPQEAAEDMFFRLVKQLAEKEGVTEQLKADNQMLWVRKMNNIRNRANEIISSELIYV